MAKHTTPPNGNVRCNVKQSDEVEEKNSVTSYVYSFLDSARFYLNNCYDTIHHWLKVKYLNYLLDIYRCNKLTE